MNRGQEPPEPDSKRTGERGQTLIEYGLIAALVCLVGIVVFGVLVPVPFETLAQRIVAAFPT